MKIKMKNLSIIVVFILSLLLKCGLAEMLVYTEEFNTKGTLYVYEPPEGIKEGDQMVQGKNCNIYRVVSSDDLNSEISPSQVPSGIKYSIVKVSYNNNSIQPTCVLPTIQTYGDDIKMNFEFQDFFNYYNSKEGPLEDYDFHSSQGFFSKVWNWATSGTGLFISICMIILIILAIATSIVYTVKKVKKEKEDNPYIETSRQEYDYSGKDSSFKNSTNFGNGTSFRVIKNNDNDDANKSKKNEKKGGLPVKEFINDNFDEKRFNIGSPMVPNQMEENNEENSYLNSPKQIDLNENNNMYGSGNRSQNDNMYGSGNRSQNGNMYGSGNRSQNSIVYGSGNRSQNSSFSRKQQQTFGNNGNENGSINMNPLSPTSQYNKSFNKGMNTSFKNNNTDFYNSNPNEMNSPIEDDNNNNTSFYNSNNNSNSRNINNGNYQNVVKSNLNNSFSNGLNPNSFNNNNNSISMDDSVSNGSDYSSSQFKKLLAKPQKPMNVLGKAEDDPRRTSSLIVDEEDKEKLANMINNNGEVVIGMEDENEYNNNNDNNNNGNSINRSFNNSNDRYNNINNLNQENMKMENENNDEDDEYQRIYESIPPMYRGMKTFKIHYPFRPHRDDELKVKVGQLLKVLKTFEDGWVLGYNIITGEKGFIPRNKIRLAEDFDQKIKKPKSPYIPINEYGMKNNNYNQNKSKLISPISQIPNLKNNNYLDVKRNDNSILVEDAGMSKGSIKVVIENNNSNISKNYEKIEEEEMVEQITPNYIPPMPSNYNSIPAKFEQDSNQSQQSENNSSMSSLNLGQPSQSTTGSGSRSRGKSNLTNIDTSMQPKYNNNNMSSNPRTPKYNNARTPKFDEPKTPKYDNPRTPKQNEPRTPKYDNPRTPKYDNARTPKFDEPRTPKYDNPRTPKYDNARTPKFDEPRTPKYDNPRTPKYDNARTPKFDEPRTPKYDNPRTPKYDNPRTPKYDNPRTPKYDEPRTPKYDNPRTPKYDESFSQNNINETNPNNSNSGSKPVFRARSSSFSKDKFNPELFGVSSRIPPKETYDELINNGGGNINNNANNYNSNSIYSSSNEGTGKRNRKDSFSNGNCNKTPINKYANDSFGYNNPTYK